MGKVLNVCLYLRYNSSSMNTKKDNCKSLQTTSFSILLVNPLHDFYQPFSSLKKQTQKFPFFLSFSYFLLTHNSKTTGYIQTFRMIALVLEIFLLGSELQVSYGCMVSYSPNHTLWSCFESLRGYEHTNHNCYDRI